MRGEFEATGLWFSAHPLEVFAAPDLLADVTPAERLESLVGQRVRVCGIPCAMRRVETRGGGAMSFVTLADRTGLVECVLFPDVHRRFGAALRDTLVWAEGRVGETLGAITLTVERAGPPVARPGRVA
ncbi:MAG: OB-fold nucleic acid binding domain-containing protein [bacterium]